MTTYNGYKFIEQQIESIINQTYQNFELVIVDDCSTDNTVDILIKYSRQDKRIKYYINEKNIGFIKNFEKSLTLCNYDLIALSDQDDIWTPDHLQLLYENIGNHDLICSNSKLLENNVLTNVTMKDVLHIDFIPDNRYRMYRHLLHSNLAQGSTILFRKNIISMALPFPLDLKFHDSWLALIAASYNGVKYLDNITLEYRQHEQNVTKNRKWKLCNNIKLANESLVQLKVLSILHRRVSSSIQEELNNILSEVISYHEYRSKRIRRLYLVIYTIKNYRDIYLKNFDYIFFMRLIKILLGY